jgi:hypothetical protein
MTDKPRNKALERVRGLMQKVLHDSSTEESRTCAVIALKVISEHALLVASQTLDLTTLTDVELLQLFAEMEKEAGRRAPAAAAAICKQCGQPCVPSLGDFMMLRDGVIHVRCSLEYMGGMSKRGGRW